MQSQFKNLFMDTRLSLIVVSVCTWLYEYIAFKWFDDYSIAIRIKKVAEWLAPWFFSAGALVADVAAFAYRTLRHFFDDFFFDQFILVWRFISVTYMMTLGMLVEFARGYSTTIQTFYMDYYLYVDATALLIILVVSDWSRGDSGGSIACPPMYKI